MPNVLRSTAHELLIARLKQARKEARLTQVQVAERLGAPQSYVAKLEGGKRRLDMVDFVRLVRAIEADSTAILTELNELLVPD